MPTPDSQGPTVDRLRVDGARLGRRLAALARTAARAGGSRLALTDADRAGRDLVAGWMRHAGLEVTVDAIGNLVGVRAGQETCRRS